MNKDLFTILKELKQIKPEAEYSKRSRFLLLAEINKSRKQLIAEKNLPKFRLANILNNFYSPRLALAAAMTVVLILIISGGIYYVNNQLNQNNLVVRATEMNASIQVKLNEIKYLLESKQPLDLNQILTAQVLLDKAANELKEISKADGDLEKSLEKIKSAQEILYQIDMLLK